jgi:hypothetical protein
MENNVPPQARHAALHGPSGFFDFARAIIAVEATAAK